MVSDLYTISLESVVGIASTALDKKQIHFRLKNYCNKIFSKALFLNFQSILNLLIK